MIATGARNRLLDVPNATLDDVLYLRTMDESELVRQRMPQRKHVVVVGAGFIGLEFAATARSKGLEVDVVELAPRVMARAVTPEISAYFHDRHTAAGIRIHYGVRATAIEGHRRQGLRRCAQRRPSRCPPISSWSASASFPMSNWRPRPELPVASGIIVNEQLLTADPNISAIGDCSLFASHRFGELMRLESVQNATDQARCVAARLTGDAKIYDGYPWFWSDQGDDKLQIAGLTAGFDQVVVRGSVGGAIVLGVLLQGRPTDRHRVRSTAPPTTCSAASCCPAADRSRRNRPRI